MRKDLITLTRQEHEQLQVIRKVQNGELRQREAGELIFYGRFYDFEGVYPAMNALKGYLRRYGIPQNLYVEKHCTYKTIRERSEDELFRGEEAQTQFERAAQELGIKLIHAHSPQAKGRIERVFGTLQDRLVKEMRLAQVSTLGQANRFLESYLPRFNAQFERV